jgi:cation/acetate symporter
MSSSAGSGWVGALMSQPAAWSVPLGFVVMIGVSLLTPGRVAPNVARTMVRLHTPEHVAVDRGSWRPRGA